MSIKRKRLEDGKWEHLVMLASGYLPLCDGDIKEAMRRALVAHHELIAALKAGAITAELPEGTLNMRVPAEGGIELVLESSPLDVP